MDEGSRNLCEARDAADALAPLRNLFALPPGIVYLDGNSLGPPPKATPPRLEDVLVREWGEGLIRSWNDAGWIDLARRVGDKIARLIGAREGEVVVADSTSVNLYKVLSVAVDLARARDPGRTVIVSEASNFPTDLYIAHGFARQREIELRLVERDALVDALDEKVAVLALTHVDYRTGEVHDMAHLGRAAHTAGALTVWDLSHTAGAMPVDVHADHADFAVGCGYKYLNGGPGAPSYVWVHPQHLVQMDASEIEQPLPGWLGHRDPFAFSTRYAPAPGIARFVCGTPPILSLAALECGVDTLLAAEAYGGMRAVKRKGDALIDMFIALVDARCAGLGLSLRTPRAAAMRGSQVSYAYPRGADAAMRSLIGRGIIGDFRAPDLLRFGLAPLYTRFVDVFDAVDTLRDVLAQ